MGSGPREARAPRKPEENPEICDLRFLAPALRPEALARSRRLIQKAWAAAEADLPCAPRWAQPNRQRDVRGPSSRRPSAHIGAWRVGRSRCAPGEAAARARGRSRWPLARYSVSPSSEAESPASRSPTPSSERHWPSRAYIRRRRPPRRPHAAVRRTQTTNRSVVTVCRKYTPSVTSVEIFERRDEVKAELGGALNINGAPVPRPRRRRPGRSARRSFVRRRSSRLPSRLPAQPPPPRPPPRRRGAPARPRPRRRRGGGRQPAGRAALPDHRRGHAHARRDPEEPRARRRGAPRPKPRLLVPARVSTLRFIGSMLGALAVRCGFVAPGVFMGGKLTPDWRPAPQTLDLRSRS